MQPVDLIDIEQSEIQVVAGLSPDRCRLDLERVEPSDRKQQGRRATMLANSPRDRYEHVARHIEYDRVD